MHWTYKFNTKSDLEQGDILLPTEYIQGVLERYFPYYNSHPDNQLYIVLSQSCDLALRDNGKCKIDYISLAPVRPLRVIIEREFNHHLRNNKPEAQAFGSDRIKVNFKDFLHKLFNNNNSHYFFIQKQPDKNIAEDMCAVVALSITIKSEHYTECQKARILQLNDIFQAKLGWLVGQKYSRVGTPDWPEEELNSKIDEVVSNTAVWVDDKLIDKIKKEIKKIEKDEPEKIIGTDDLAKIISKLPSKKKQVIDAFIELLVAEQILPNTQDSTAKNLTKRLQNCQNFARFF